MQAEFELSTIGGASARYGGLGNHNTHPQQESARFEFAVPEYHDLGPLYDLESREAPQLLLGMLRRSLGATTDAELLPKLMDREAFVGMSDGLIDDLVSIMLALSETNIDPGMQAHMCSLVRRALSSKLHNSSFDLIRADEANWRRGALTGEGVDNGEYRIKILQRLEIEAPGMSDGDLFELAFQTAYNYCAWADENETTINHCRLALGHEDKARGANTRVSHDVVIDSSKSADDVVVSTRQRVQLKFASPKSQREGKAYKTAADYDQSKIKVLVEDTMERGDLLFFIEDIRQAYLGVAESSERVRARIDKYMAELSKAQTSAQLLGTVAVR